MKGMVLVAGEGTRARPLTEFVAKPALPLPGGTVLTHLLTALRDNGIDRIALNLHYRPESIMRAIEEHPVTNVRIAPFDEPLLAGSGGGFYRIRDYFGNDQFLIHNGDTYTTVDYGEMHVFHNSHDFPITFLCEPDSSGATRVIDAAEDGVVVSIRKQPSPPQSARSYRFSGVMIMESAVFEYFPDKEIIDLFDDALIPALVNGKPVGRVWTPEFNHYDFGTPVEYYQNGFRFLREVFPNLEKCAEYLERNGWYVHKTAEISSEAEFEGYGYIGRNVKITVGSVLKNSIIFQDSVVDGAEIIESILLPAVLSPGVKIKDVILNYDGTAVS